jgi:hypothetical protein
VTAEQRIDARVANLATNIDALGSVLRNEDGYVRSLENIRREQAAFHGCGGLSRSHAGNMHRSGNGKKNVAFLADAEPAGKLRCVKDPKFDQISG